MESSTDSPLSFCGPGTLSVSLMTTFSSFLSRSTYVLELREVQHAELLCASSDEGSSGL